MSTIVFEKPSGKEHPCELQLWCRYLVNVLFKKDSARNLKVMNFCSLKSKISMLFVWSRGVSASFLKLASLQLLALVGQFLVYDNVTDVFEFFWNFSSITSCLLSTILLLLDFYDYFFCYHKCIDFK